MRKIRGPKPKPIHLKAEQRAELERLTRRNRVNRGLAFRARVILMSADGIPGLRIAKKLRSTNQTICRWRKRFLDGGIDALYDESKPGTPRKITDDKLEEIVVKTLEEKPEGATHWSTRMMAKKTGWSQSQISRIWRTFGLKPHRASTYTLSKDPLFIEKVRDVVGLYMTPPANALVLSVDEKSQIQALNRTQPILPMRPGHEEKQTPDYDRHGTTTLFAALNVKTGKVIGKCYSRHRAQEFRKFLDHVEENVPADMDIHMILDNYGTHKTPIVHRWLLRHPRFHLHFIPTHSSWLNLVERWFALLTERQIKRGAHTSVNQLKATIEKFIAINNESPKPFVWTKTADEIFEKIARYSKGTLRAHSEKELSRNE
jgi:transposase